MTSMNEWINQSLIFVSLKKVEGKIDDTGVYLFIKTSQHTLDSKYQDAHREGLGFSIFKDKEQGSQNLIFNKIR